MKKHLLTKTLLMAVMLLGGVNFACADDYILYSQDYSNAETYNQYWTTGVYADSYVGSTKNTAARALITQASRTVNESTEYYIQLRSDNKNNRGAYFSIPTTGNEYDYTIEFDVALRAPYYETSYINWLIITSTSGTDLAVLNVPSTNSSSTHSPLNIYDSQTLSSTIATCDHGTRGTVGWYHVTLSVTSANGVKMSVTKEGGSSVLSNYTLSSSKANISKLTIWLNPGFISDSGPHAAISNFVKKTTYSAMYSYAKSEYDTRVASLDAAGQTYWSSNVTAPSSVTTSALYDAAIAALPTTYLAAVKAQTTAGSDMTDALKTAVDKSSWTNATGTYASVAAERYNGDTPYSSGKILYQTVDGLHAGYYKVKFYGVANVARTLTDEYYGSGIAQMYANSETQDVDVIYQDACSPISDTYLREFEVYLAEDNSSIEFGIQNIKAGGQWYVAQALSLNYLGSEKNDYTINAVAGGVTIKELATGSVWASENYGTYVPYVIEKDSKFYVLDDNSTYYKSFTMGATDETKEVSYTLDESVVYFAEANSIYGGHSSYGTYSNDSKYSMGNGVGCYTDAYITTSSTLAPGTYNIMLGCVVRNGNKTQPYGISYSSDKETWTSTGISISYSGTAGSVYTPSANIQLASTSYLRLINNYGGNAQDYLDYVLIRNFSAETSAFNSLKTYADALVAVPNDNAAANSTFSTAISTQAAAVAAATTADAITTATSALRTAMNTYVAAANPTAGNQFDLTYLLINPDLEDITDWGDAAAQGWFTDIPRSGLGQYNNFAVRTNLNSSKNGVERYTSDAYTTAGTYALYQMVTLPAGNYSFDANAFANKSSTIVMAAGSIEGDAVTATDFTAYTVDFSVASEAETKMGLKISATGTNACNWMAITEIKLYKEAGFSVFGTIPSSGYGSLASAYGLDFANATVSSGTLTAYVVTSTTNESVKLTSVDELPANSGVILKGTPGATYSIPLKADAAYDGTNLLSAAVTATPIEANTAYILQSGAFHLVNAASTIPAGKAYLLASNVPSGARAMKFVFDDETTAVSEELRVNSKEFATAPVFNLNGQRIEKPAKGLYIMNGKKVVVK